MLTGPAADHRQVERHLAGRCAVAIPSIEPSRARSALASAIIIVWRGSRNRGQGGLASVLMTWWRRKRGAAGSVGGAAGGGPRGRTDGPDMAVDLSAIRLHAQEFAASRRGVEGYVEPATNISTTTLVLVAHDGEWTRRAVGSPVNAFGVCREFSIPVYDVNQTGYPARMREWSRRQRGG